MGKTHAPRPGHVQCWTPLFTAFACLLAFAAWPLKALAAETTHPPLFIMRHALAPGVGDPPAFDLSRCDTQRTLNDVGRAQARAVGDWLREQGIAQALVWASPWCRTRETAELLGLGAVRSHSALASFFQQGDAQATTAELRQALRDWRLSQAKPALVMVTHQVNISALLGRGAAPAEVLRLRLDGRGELLNAASESVYRAP